jgi:HAD superfamily hydrolase (TIGR01450 family)
VLAEQFDAFLFDLDGVVYLGDRALPHAKESLARLRGEGKQIRFLTNDPRPTRAEVARRLKGMGIEALAEGVVTSSWATAEHLRREGIRSAYVVGSPGLEFEVRRAGVEVARSRRPEAVVVGADERTSYPHIERAVRLISDGAIFVATNLDGSFPTPEDPSPAAGAITAAVEAASGRRPAVIGKPYPSMFEAATESLGAGTRVVMVGDNPKTDILGAHRYGINGVLVSEEVPAFPSERDFRAPDATIPHLLSLFDPATTARRWEKPSFPWPDSVAAGVAAVVFDDAGRVLLGKRADNGLWGLPSGRVEPAETLEEATSREVREETGLEIEVRRFIWVYSHPESQVFAYKSGEVTQFVTSCFACRVVGGSLRADGVEALDASFFEVGALPTELLPMHPGWLGDALASQEAPRSQ